MGGRRGWEVWQEPQHTMTQEKEGDLSTKEKECDRGQTMRRHDMNITCIPCTHPCFNTCKSAISSNVNINHR